MRLLKWISMLTVFAMLCVVLPATVAEDEIVIDLEQAADDGLDLEVEGEALEAFDDSALSPEDIALELDGLESNLLTSETAEQSQAPTVSNASGDFQIDEEGIATVTNGGLVTAIAEGYAGIYVETDNGHGNSIGIYVTPLHPHPDSITIDQSSPIMLYPGEQYALTTTMSPADAAAELTWGSYDTNVATVSSNGVITAVARGYTEIWVETDNNRDAFIDVNVLTRPQAVTLDETKVTVDVGESLFLYATVTPYDADTDLIWSSSKPSVAKVDRSGWVTGLKPGTAVITVKTDNGKTATATVTVKANPTKVKLNKTKATLGVKEKLTLKVTFTPAAAVTPLTWSSSKPKVARVNKKGKVTAVGKGTAVITAKAKNGKKAKATVTVVAAPDQVTLNKTGTVTLKKGKTLKLKAKLPKNTASALTWSSSKPKVARVDKKGVVTALKKGTAVITVRTFNKKTAKVTIRVK